MSVFGILKSKSKRRRRVVITGLGVIAPNGIGKDEFWEANIEGKSGVSKIESFDVSDLNSKIAAQVKDFDPLKYIPKEVARRTDRFVHLGFTAGKLALEDSKLNLQKEDKYRIGKVDPHRVEEISRWGKESDQDLLDFGTL